MKRRPWTTKERPILFSGPMVRAILEGTKSQTRRVVKPQPVSTAPGLYADRYNKSEQWAYWLPDNRMDAPRTFTCPYGQPGDRLWVRETCVIAPPHFGDDDREHQLAPPSTCRAGPAA